MKARREGFVLIAALWLVVALGAVGLDASLRSRARRLAAANLLDQTRARAVAMGGAEYARSRLTAAMLGRAVELRAAAQNTQTGRGAAPARAANMQQLFRQADPSLDPWREPEELIAAPQTINPALAALELRDTGAALNLNESDENMLRQFFAQGLRLDFAQADQLTQAIMDWRDQDELPRIGGGEREQYIDANAAVLPPNRPFADLDELRHVMGMTAELFTLIRPYLTMVSSGRINVNAAPEPVLLALPGMTPGGVTALLSQRQAGRLPRSEAELRAMLPGNAATTLNATRTEFNRRATYTTDEVEIAATVDLPGSPIGARVRMVVTRGNTGANVIFRKYD
jgi:general secretion pathway protein K